MAQQAGGAADWRRCAWRPFPDAAVMLVQLLLALHDDEPVAAAQLCTLTKWAYRVYCATQDTAPLQRCLSAVAAAVPSLLDLVSGHTQQSAAAESVLSCFFSSASPAGIRAAFRQQLMEARTHEALARALVRCDRADCARKVSSGLDSSSRFLGRPDQRQPGVMLLQWRQGQRLHAVRFSTSSQASWPLCARSTLCAP